MTIEASASRELRIALFALKVFLAVVGLEVAGQRLPVLECGPALVARKGLVGGRVEVFVNGQVIFP